MRRELVNLKSLGVDLTVVLALALSGPLAAAPVEINVNLATVVNLPANRLYLLGGQIEIACSVSNGGTETSDDITIRYYVSTNSGISTSDCLMGSVTHGPLGPGENDYVTATLTLPTDFPKGWAYVGIIATCPKDPWPDWHNTESVARIRLAAPYPDLAIGTVDAADGTYPPGGQITVTVAVKNVGGKTSEAYTISFTANDHTIGAASRAGLAPDQVDSFDVVCTLPADLPDGEYGIAATVDCPEDDDLSNNRKSDASLIFVCLLPDLAVQSVDASDGIYQPGDQIVVDTLIENVGDRPSERYTVRYYASADTSITWRDYSLGQVTRSSLAPGERDSVNTTCQLPAYIPKGDFYIAVTVSSSRDGDSRNNQRHDDTPVTFLHPAGYVCGQAQYEDTSGWTHPIRYAQVQIWQAGSPAVVVGRTGTDGYGTYGFMLPLDGGSSSHICVRVLTAGAAGACPGTTSGICMVKDDVLRQLYMLASPFHPYPLDSSTTINLTSPRTTGEFMVYDSVVEGFVKTKGFFGAELEPITVYWPSADNGTYYAPSKGIFIQRYDRGDRDVILHEYGHYVADSHGFALGSVGLNPIHYWNTDLRLTPYYRTDDEGRNLAFREAWATLFSIATQYGDTSLLYSGDTKYQDFDEITTKALWIDLETDTYGARSPGEYYENMNCCALWDIFDDHNDLMDDRDTLSDTALAKIWSIAAEDKPKDILDFWNSWFERYEYAAEMMRIFRRHRMLFPCPKPSPTVETFESGDLGGFAWTSQGNEPWIVVAGAGRQGTYGVKAGAIKDSQTSTLEITITCDTGWIRFWRKLSSEKLWDKLQFFIDGTKKGEWSGELDWEQVSFPVDAGARRFTWTYRKDDSSAEGADTAWLDDIEFPVW